MRSAKIFSSPVFPVLMTYFTVFWEFLRKKKKVSFTIGTGKENQGIKSPSSFFQEYKET